MKVYVFFLGLCCFCWKVDADSKTYLVTAPLSLRLDADETVFVELFGYTEEVRVFIYLKTSMAPDHVELSKDDLTLNAANKHKATAKLRIFHNDIPKDAARVVLHVLTESFNNHIEIPVSRSNGFLFIQTDKPLYTPRQQVNVRAFSMNEELKPAKRSVFLTFRDPKKVIVDVVEIPDKNTGIPTMQNPFKIPVKPTLGIWTIEASYSDHFTTKATTDFEVKEYVLPSFTIQFEPTTNYISFNQFRGFSFKITAKYLHGAPVDNAECFIRYGYVGKKDPVIITTSLTRTRLSSDGEAQMRVDMEDVLKRHDGPRDLGGLQGQYLYVAVLVTEDTGGITQEAEFASVKFVRSPFHMRLISTPPFIKPGLPYNIQVQVQDHLGKPVSEVPVRLVQRDMLTSSNSVQNMHCQESPITGSTGLAYFICTPDADSAKVILKFKTAQPNFPEQSQAILELTAQAYYSPNRRYLYINTPMFGKSLLAGHYANIQVFTSSPSFLRIKTLSYLVISRGKVIHHESQAFSAGLDNSQNLNFLVTSAMVPSVRLLVYYVLDGEGTPELVADSVWLDVKAKCVNGLNLELNNGGDSTFSKTYKPKEELQLNINANRDGVVALSAVDPAVFSLRTTYRDPFAMVQHHIEKSDMGCGGGGGKNNADVFRLAGLTFMTNANAAPVSSTEPCTAHLRAKRALTEEEKNNKAQSYGDLEKCCKKGMSYIPKSLTCSEYVNQGQWKNLDCKKVYLECCEFIQQSLDSDETLVLARHQLGANFDETPSMVRSYFPESWFWESQEIKSGKEFTVRKSLPDSLTTWEFKAIGMFENGGMCVADPMRISVTLPLSLDIPLPYQVVRGEQIELLGSVYNQLSNSISYCVTLRVGPEICLLESNPVEGGMHATPCNYQTLSPDGVAKVRFTVLGLEPGDHTLRFTLKTRNRDADIVEKKLTVVPDGVRRDLDFGGRLDPQGVYGPEKISVKLPNRLPENIVPSSTVKRVLTINGELPAEVVTVIGNPEGFTRLISMPEGSAIGQVERVLPYIDVYDYLETSRSWELLGTDVMKSSKAIKEKIKEGLQELTTFIDGDSGYSMWRSGDASTGVTAEVVSTLAKAEKFVSVRRDVLSYSVRWLMQTQAPDGSFSEKSPVKISKVMVEGSDPLEKSVYLTSSVLIALVRATSIKEDFLQLRSHETSKEKAVTYISRKAPQVKSVYVRAIAAYALTLHNTAHQGVTDLFDMFEKEAHQKGNPVELRYWRESGTTTEWLKPDESSGQTVETTAYILLATLNRGRVAYANPILSWLSQDQNYGEGYFSMKDAMLTLEALTKYSDKVRQTVLDQQIRIRFAKKGTLKEVTITKKQPVSPPLEINKNDDILVSTGFGKGVSNVKLRTVFYQTTASTQPNCKFDISVKVVGPAESTNPSLRAPHLVACAKYKPPPGEKYTESELTEMRIQLRTGVEPILDDLRQFRDGLAPVISDFSLEGNTVVIRMDSVPSNSPLCVGFRIKNRFKVLGSHESLLTVREPNDKGGICTKSFSDEQQKLQRLCVDEVCQCMTADCATFKAQLDTTLTLKDREREICKPIYKYAFKIKVTSKASEGDFLVYNSVVVESLHTKGPDFRAARGDTKISLVKKASCLGVELKENEQYMLIGSTGTEFIEGDTFKYRVPLDSGTVVETWPIACETQECTDYLNSVADLGVELTLNDCQVL